MPEEPSTEELQAEQMKRELAARRAAETAPDDEETAQYERRAEKAHYLREKLDERAAAEREVEEDGD
ncbi:MAG TPA: hypothetical protein VKR21_01655 [Solirubrobacteraceae bacterium]|nr:hypothetical protein [Solirubrobacteraceae bacterium]